MKARLAGPIIRDSIVDGEGLRAVVWFQGCRRQCKGCHNPESWDFNGGVEVDTDYIKDKLRTFKGQTGLTLSGGEPMWQAEAALEIARFAKEEMGWNVWSFSGFLYDDIKAGRDGATPAMWELVKELDALIDGPFILSERDLTCKFRGSRNQRLLRLKGGEIESIE
ncbi:MAG: anaerobic ribonucleoside-triphosphate reductase activating protein [Candidatus Nomurabacteria bacterium]|jgi:anaerobic ribonucleoside-triphosphate reductase activating protein|nr:anaerobic ribonucleoside-triphosphate reductase activating protein [Candidatus Nomurabacteria bacterium]